MGFISDLFGGGGGGQAKDAFKAFQGGVGKANKLMDWTTPFGQSQARLGTANTQAGLSTLDTAKDYWTGILSGSRPAQMAAAAPP